ncbi:MAG TPA: hypothetical protein VM075_05040, partial [Anaerolineae bacterium]|nr:hypothetical protein [Anaerolineae bacterium]
NIPDQYDIRNVYATNSQTTTTPYHFVRYDTQDNLYINIGASTAIYYDADDITTTGELIDCPEGSDFDRIGADFMVYFDMRSGICDIYRYNSISLKNDIWVSGNCDGAPSGHPGPPITTTVEIDALADDLGLFPEFAVYLLFENRQTGGPGDDDLCFRYEWSNGGGEGCTPGYWKQSQHFDSWVKPPYYPDGTNVSYFDDVFDRGPHVTLLKALGTGGGGEKALGRHAVAALLNAVANSGVDYLYSTADVIHMVQVAYDTGDFEGIKDLFAGENEAYCPLDGVIQE